MGKKPRYNEPRYNENPGKTNQSLGPDPETTFYPCITKFTYSKWFEPRSISSSCSVIVRVSVVLKRTVGDSD